MTPFFIGSLITAQTFLTLKVALLVWFHCSEPLTIQTLTNSLHKMIFDILFLQLVLEITIHTIIYTVQTAVITRLHINTYNNS